MEFLEQLEKEAREDAVPIVRREMQSFLKFLMAAARPKTDPGKWEPQLGFCSFDV